MGTLPFKRWARRCIPVFYILSLAVCSYLFFWQNLIQYKEPFLFQWDSYDITGTFYTALNVLYVTSVSRGVVFLFAALCGVAWVFDRDSDWAAFGLTVAFLFCFCAVVYPNAYSAGFPSLAASEQGTVIESLLSVNIKNRYTLTAKLLIEPPLAIVTLFQTYKLRRFGKPGMARASVCVAALNTILCVCNVSTGLGVLALLIAYINWRNSAEQPPAEPLHTPCGKIYIIEASVFLVYSFLASVIGFDTPTLPASASLSELFLLNAFFMLLLFLFRHFLRTYRDFRNTEDVKDFLLSISSLYFIAFSAMLYPYHYTKYIINNNELIRSYQVNDVDACFFPCVSVLSITLFIMYNKDLKKHWYIAPLLLVGVICALFLSRGNNLVNDAIGSIPSLLIAGYGFFLMHSSKHTRA